ncbi:prephenate dehydrogenase (NADP(+)) [Aspergillus fumigatus]|nr:prephenate dehydrogenase (NADP(+)) [Aspergillus fumigatus]KAH1339896.1 prephenate dehydrogenase (NADP(+)) [Aspergillus fumigatus]KAH1605721.1 prephenate dehydrogenase (NADP(+)) [Aspergillus fumigatus]KAH1610252.1 prephenate dehydrogenase (NADP(+)) [Aspergillus fumigatus]KAH1633258.1 prephenate dehydrogenase (NADP(+)) [Aspergillus fumigatus]
MSSNKPYVIKGIPVDAGQIIPVRRDIDEWYEDTSRQSRIQLSIFIWALREFQSIDYKDRLSYFQIAGIHHFPLITWDEEEPPVPNKPGYCVHNNVTFPTWHRPYMLLFEQRLFEIMETTIKETVPESHKQEWRDAARQWRLPYWDFAKTSGPHATGPLSLPVLCGLANVVILNPANPETPIELPNPVYKYRAPDLMGNLDKPFHIPPERIDPDKDDYYPWDKCQATTKYGLLKNNPHIQDAGQDVTKSNLALNEHPWYRPNKAGFPPLQTLTYEVHRLLSFKFSSWGAFASTKWCNEENKPPASQQTRDILSLEYIHNNVHNWVGGTDYLGDPSKPDLQGAGHMSSVPVAAFDPIFWLYHNNVDRLTAIWQVLNQDHWFDEPHPSDAKPDDPLKPFHVSKDKYFTSDDARFWRKYGYDYDIVKKPGTNEDRAPEEVKMKINQLYGEPISRLHEGQPVEYDYVINVIYDRYALDGIPYTIVFYLHLKDGSYKCLGGVYTFSTKLSDAQDTERGGCDNCREQKKAGVLASAQIPLTYTLYERQEWHNLGKLLPVKETADIIRQHLCWKVVGVNNSILFDSEQPMRGDPATWRSLDVTAAYSDIHYPVDRNYKYIDRGLPAYHNYLPIHLSPT